MERIIKFNTNKKDKGESEIINNFPIDFKPKFKKHILIV